MSQQEVMPTNVVDLEHESDGEIMSSGSDTDVSSDMWCLEDDIADIVSGAWCTCGADGRAHKQDCPMNLRNRYSGLALFLGHVLGELLVSTFSCVG